MPGQGDYGSALSLATSQEDDIDKDQVKGLDG
jgi:hypothetical protein